MSNAEGLVIPGVVASGLGKGAYFISLAWVEARLTELIGRKPYPGTLNLRVPVELREALFALRRQFAPVVAPGEQSCSGYLAAVSLHLQASQMFDAWAILPEMTEHTDIIEIVSAHCLRGQLGLNDGDRLELRVRQS